MFDGVLEEDWVRDQATWAQSQVASLPTSSRGYSGQKFPMTAEANVTLIFQDDKEEELGK